MAKYRALIGRRVEVYYRAGDIFLPATGVLAADSGKSIFLEEHFCQHGRVKSFRWEIPYQCIIRLSETEPSAGPSDVSSLPAPENRSASTAPLAPMKSRPQES